MTPDDFQSELDKQDADKQKQQDKQDEIKAINKAGIKNVEATNANTASTKKTLQDGSAKVAVTNPDLAKSDDLQNVTDAIHKMNMTAFITNDGLPKLAKGLSDFTDKVKELSNQYQDQGFVQLSKQLGSAVDALNKVSSKLTDTKIKVDVPLQKTIDGLQKSIKAIDFNPTVNVSAPDTKVVTTPVDLKPVITSLSKVEKAITDSKPENEDIDLSPIISGLSDVQNAIQALRFPVPNYVLPFKDVNGKDVQVQLDSSGNIPTSGGGSGGGGTQYAEGTTTSPATGNLSLGRYQTSAPTLTNGQLYGLQLDSSGNLKVTGSLSVGGTVDEASFTAGSSTFNPSGGVFNDSVAALTAGQQGTQRLTANRGLHTNLRKADGTELGISTAPLRVDPTGTTTQPVSLTSTTITGTVGVTQSTSPWVVSNGGTFAVQAAQSGTWNINNISGTVSLPTGASTSALQTTGNTSLASIVTNTNNLTVGQGSTTSGQTGQLVQGAVTTSAPTYTTAQTSPLSLDTSGNLRTTTTLGASSNVIGHVITDTGSTTVVTGTVTVAGTVTANAGTNLNTSALALESGGNLASIKTDVDNLNLSQGSTTSGQKGNLILGATTTSAPTYTTAQSNPLSLTTAGGLRVDASATTQPVSASSLPLPTGAATSANQTNASQKTQIVDGSGNVIASTSNALNVAITSGGGSGGTASSFGATFPATGTAIGAKNGANMVNLAADGSSNLLVNLATAIPTGSNTIGSIANSSFTATQATGTNLHTVVDSGSITANAGTNLNTSALALDATLTGGTAKSIVRGGAKGTTTAADVTSTASGSNHQPIDVAIYDGSGNQVTSFGGGTQYTNNASQATPTGTVALGYDGTNVRALKTAADGTSKTVLSAYQANVTGTITSSSSTVTATDLTGVGSLTVQITGTYAGVNVTFEVSIDGTNWVPIAAMPVGSTNPSVVTSTGVLTSNSTNVWNVSPLLGLAQFRVRSTAFTSGTANVTLDLSAQFVQYSSVNSDTVSQPTAANLNATVVGTGTFPVQATLAAETTKVIGTVNQGTSPWVVNTGSATGSAVPANAFYGGYLDSAGNLAGARLVTSTTNTVANILGAANVAVFDDVSPTSISENSFGTVRMSANRNLYGTIRDAAGNERGVNVTAGNALTVDGSASTQPVSAASLPLPSGAATSANQSTEITSLATLVTSTHAEDAASASGDTGVFALGVRNDTVADSTNANGDYSQLSTDVKGHLLTAAAPRSLKTQQQTTITSSTTETTVLTAVASTFLDVYGVIVTNTSATACAVTFKDATAGTTRFILQIPAGDTRGFMLPIDAAHNQAAVNNNWTATCGTSVASIQITMMAVKNI